ncbi:MAG: hypothetical protein A7316_06440 [Candidatus Altiarchaeales archaeon WOR_SM1_86-2]|nr:MAG: hypothetical protein A7316_06440 [Candidatus Altiarchaeales archaeon WOR_SM1_86-2]
MNRYQLAKEIAEDLKTKFGDKVSSIVLFGSVAKGEDKEESDIDLLIVSKEHLSRALDDSIGKILRNGFVPEILNLTDVEFTQMKNIGSPFYFSIKNEGIKLC